MDVEGSFGLLSRVWERRIFCLVLVFYFSRCDWIQSAESFLWTRWGQETRVSLFTAHWWLVLMEEKGQKVLVCFIADGESSFGSSFFRCGICKEHD